MRYISAYGHFISIQELKSVNLNFILLLKDVHFERFTRDHWNKFGEFYEVSRYSCVCVTLPAVGAQCGL